jgi:hypothetical protein
MELLLRLREKNPDGSYRVVGYEKHEGGKIYQSNLSMQFAEIIFKKPNPSLGDRRWVCDFYIPHDRYDIYTGITVNGEKVFERDQFKYAYGDVGTVLYDKGEFKVFVDNRPVAFGVHNLIDSKHWKRIGYEGQEPESY